MIRLDIQDKLLNRLTTVEGKHTKCLFCVLGILPVLWSCTVGPNYQRPTANADITRFKELKGWKPAEPGDALLPEQWWQLFQDDYLNSLIAQANNHNFSLAQAEAQFRQAQELVHGAQAAFFPEADLSANTSRFRAASGQNVAVSGVKTLFALGASVAWELDLWGNVRRQVESQQANAQASFATLQALRLFNQATLAQTYFQLRALEDQKRLLQDTKEAYGKSLDIARLRYETGVSPKADFVQAQTQLESSKAQLLVLDIQRAKLEHAIALLIGKTPAELTITETGLQAYLPDIPVSVPSKLLERRPDIAVAERQVAAANAQIGVAKAVYFPTVSLSADTGFQSGTLSTLFSTATRYWALGPAAFALPLFEGGARSAQMAAAIAGFDASVANYRQTVLTGFQEVEDQLAALRILEQDHAIQATALALAKEALALTLSQFQAGTVVYKDVMLAQMTLLDNQKAALTLQAQQLEASVQLVKALGGGWHTGHLPKRNNIAGKVKLTRFLPVPEH
jgi:NodT family efflux transporter outer membrane factor (OMF) lipoprotein